MNIAVGQNWLKKKPIGVYSSSPPTSGRNNEYFYRLVLFCHYFLSKYDSDRQFLIHLIDN